MSLKICIIVGTRPEALKLAPVYRSLRESSCLQPVLLSTGQHREMLDQALGAFGIQPDSDLNLMLPSQTLPELTGRVVTQVATALNELRPAAVLVQGDTTTVLGSALAAFYCGIPVGHVEAGLRTGNMLQPWPEEMNRRLTSPLSRWNFVPTEASRANLLREAVPEDSCYVTGNTVVDALLWMRESIREAGLSWQDVSASLKVSPQFGEQYLARQDSRLILVTGHRRESFGSGFEQLCDALLQVAEDHGDVGILFPVHLNPAVREPVLRRLGQHPRIELTEPADYKNFIWLMDRCHFIISDSGGVQEEAPSLGKPVLVTRDTTERPEGVQAGVCQLVGMSAENICREASRLLTDDSEYQRRTAIRNPYGDGQASDRITRILEQTLAAESATAVGVA